MASSSSNPSSSDSRTFEDIFKDYKARPANEMASSSSDPRTVKDIFKNYKARRRGLIQALTLDADAFYRQCDPAKENLSLYGLLDGSWKLSTPSRVPLKLPDPTMGINFARDGTKREKWLRLIAMHSDSWLLSVAFFYGVGLNHNDREQLFRLINDLSTVYESVTQAHAVKDKPTTDSNSKWKSRKISIGGPVRIDPRVQDEDNGEDDDELRELLCEICGGIYYADEFWICCDICEKWFHGSCANTSPVKAESSEQFKCPSCILKKAG